MAGQMNPELVSLRRHETSVGWGFRMHGGRDVQLPLFVCQVTASSIAGKAGVGAGDAIIAICNTNVMQFTHQEAKNEMLRAGNEVDLWVVRGVVNPKDPDVKAACGVGGGGPKRGTVDEGSIDPKMNEGTKYRDVMPKSYRMLEAQLGGPVDPPQPNATPAQPMQPVHSQAEYRPQDMFVPQKEYIPQDMFQPPQGHTSQDLYQPQASASAPSSIFNRQKDERSDYLKAQGESIQKAYGQSRLDSGQSDF